MTQRAIKKLFAIKDRELPPALWSALLFFLILCGYYIVRPLREEMGLAGGVKNLPWLYLANLGVMLALAPVFGAVATRWARKTFIPAVYLFFMTNMMMFFMAMRLIPEGEQLLLGRIFYVWVSVYNMWAVSLFWAFMADGFGLNSGKRLFGLIAVGGSLGAVFGSSIASLFIEWVGRPNLILVSSFFLLAAALVIIRLGRLMPETIKNRTVKNSARGHFWTGMTEFFRSPYLMAIGGYLFLFSLSSTFLYFEQAEIVDAAFSSREAKARVFANMDFWVNSLTFLIQIFFTGRLISRLGVGGVLVILPILTIIGFTIMGFAPTLAVLVVFQVARRATNYALSRPARETLFTIVSRDQKYKAKSFIDTFVYRGGDMLGATAFSALSSLGIGLSGIAFIAVPPALLWGSLGLFLGKKQLKQGENQ
ncbi:MAG: MFS transporter [bacterium]|nr:MFS transporter [bacterium]